MRRALWVGLIAIFLWLPSAMAAETIPSLATISTTLPDAQAQSFTQQREVLQQQLGAFLSAAEAFNAKTAENQSDAEYDAVQSQRTAYIKAAEAFNDSLAAAVRIITIKDMDTLAKQLGWRLEKQTRLHSALGKLSFDGDPDVPGLQISGTWQSVLARGQDAALAREAAQKDGLGFPGAGMQTVNDDCAIFALANAAGLPYGVVAARATDLIHQGAWREPVERANPQGTIEKKGLNGGEVIMLAESFGQAEVVPSSNFAKTLSAGRPIMVNVVSADGNVNNGHEVVLTKTFQHNGETWFEMMDSNQGPQKRLFLSSKELHTMLQENGVAYRPEPGTTSKLLH